MTQYTQTNRSATSPVTNTTKHKDLPLWERLAVRALVSVVFDKDYRRHIHRAKIAARRAEFEQNFERAQSELRKGARI